VHARNQRNIVTMGYTRKGFMSRIILKGVYSEACSKEDSEVDMSVAG